MEACENYDEKSVISGAHILSFPSAFLGIVVWTICENASKRLRFRIKTHQCRQKNEKTSKIEIFYHVLVETKTDSF